MLFSVISVMSGLKSSLYLLWGVTLFVRSALRILRKEVNKVPYEPEGYYVIKGKFTWAQLVPILGKSIYGIQKDTDSLPSKADEPCGLSPSPEGLTYQIYSKWKVPIGSRVVHVVLHPDGICFSGALRVAQDWNYAKELFLKVISVLERYQVVNSEIHKEGGEPNDKH